MLLRVGRTGRRQYGALNMGALLDSISEVPTAARQASDPTLLALPRLDRDAQSASHYTSCATILASSVSTPAVEAKNAAIAATEPTNMPAVSPSRTARARTHAARASPATARPMPMPMTTAPLRSPSAPPTLARNRAPTERAGERTVEREGSGACMVTASPGLKSQWDSSAMPFTAHATARYAPRHRHPRR